MLTTTLENNLRRMLVAALLVVWSVPLASRADWITTPWLGASPTRSVLDLAGEWRVVEAKGIQTASTVRVPFFVEDEGELVLEREFDLDSTFADRQAWLVAYGVSRECEIWLNDRFVGSHVGGWSSFAIDLDEAILKIPGRNRLRIHVVGQYKVRDSLPLRHRPKAWRGGTGIASPFYLLFAPRVAVRDVRVQTSYTAARSGAAELSLEISRRSDSPAAGLFWRAELVDPGSGKVLAASKAQQLDFGGKLRTQVQGKLGPVAVSPWSPETPKLYTVRLSLTDGSGEVLDETEQRVGFRSLVSREGRLFLNGQPFLCRAVELVGEKAAPPGLDRKDWALGAVRQIKELGCNAVRVAAGPPDPALVAAADSLGLFVFEEIPLWKVPTPILLRSSLLEQAVEYATEMVTRDRNHPSVIAWGLAEGLDYWDPRVGNALTKIRNQVALLDSRPTYLDASFTEASRTKNHWPADWILLDVVDRNHRAEVPESLKGEVVLPVVGFLPYRPARAHVPPEVIEENRSLRLLRMGRDWLNSPRPAGLVVRSWRDWRGPSPLLWLGPPPTEWLPYGVLRKDGSRRLLYRVVRSLFAGGEAPRMRFLSFAPEKTALFTLLSLLAVALFLWYFRRDRRFRGNIRRIFIYPSSIYEDVRSSRKIFAYHTFLQGFLTALSFAILSSSVLFFLKRSLIFDELADLLVGQVAGKAILVWLSWHPGWSLLVFTGVGFLGLILVAWVVWVLGFVLGYYIPLGQCLTFVFWISTAFLPGILWGTVAYRLMIHSRGFLWVTLVLWALLGLWFFVRLIRGTATIFRRPAFLTASIWIALLAAMAGSALMLLQHERAFLTYLGYYFARIFAG